MNVRGGCQGQMLLTSAKLTFVSGYVIQTSGKPLIIYLLFVSRMTCFLKYFGCEGSALNINHLYMYAQAGKTGV